MNFTKFSSSSGLADAPPQEFFAVHCSRCQRPATDEPILKTEVAAICAALALGWKIRLPGITPGQLVGVESFNAVEMFCPRCALEF